MNGYLLGFIWIRFITVICLAFFVNAVGLLFSCLFCFSFSFYSIKCDCCRRVACCSVVKSAPQCLCLVWVDARSVVLASLEYFFWLLLLCLPPQWVSPAALELHILFSAFC